jgi:hypothetical protein
MSVRWLLAFVAPVVLLAQTDFQQSGYVDWRGWTFPQTTYNDRAHFVGEALVHYDVTYGFGPRWKLTGGTETRMDSHRQTERDFRINIDDRGRQRPNFSIRRVSVIHNRGPVTVEVGKQLIRWGKAGILNPTDRFAPRDFLAVVDNDILAVHAARVIFERKSNSLELVAQPLFTPSRIPLLNQRWTVLPEQIRAIPINDQGSRLPGGTQWGARWNHLGRRYEMSLSFFDGHNHLPLFEGSFNGRESRLPPLFPADAHVRGGCSRSVEWLTIKAEAAFFRSNTPQADEYALYVIQLERKSSEWSFVGGYAGEAVTRRRTQPNFAPDRGLARAFFGRASYDIDVNRSIELETAVRENGKGLWLKSEYSEAWGQNWRGTVGFTLLRGAPTDFLGQYRRNSFFNLSLRYSFSAGTARIIALSA